MTYANPQFDILFASAALLVLFYVWSFRRRKRLAEKFVDPVVYETMTRTLSVRKRMLKVLMLAAGLWLAVFSFLRPQWGFKWEEMKRRGLDILIAMDVSKSMDARDVKPDRLERAKLAVKDMVGKLKADRIGLIAFAGSAFLQCPLTLDYSGFMLALDDLDTATIPRPGTAIAAAIRQAIKVLEGADKKFKVLVIITDGEDHEGDPVKASMDARKEGLKIFCVGVGSKEGELVPIIDERGGRGFLRDASGNVVKSRLNEDILQKIALNTGGAYIHATGSDFGLNTLYKEKISKLEKREFESKMRKQFIERFQIFLAIAAILLFLEPLIGERRADVE